METKWQFRMFVYSKCFFFFSELQYSLNIQIWDVSPKKKKQVIISIAIISLGFKRSHQKKKMHPVKLEYVCILSTPTMDTTQLKNLKILEAKYSLLTWPKDI